MQERERQTMRERTGHGHALRGLDDRWVAGATAVALGVVGAVASALLAGTLHVSPMYFVVFVAGVVAGPVLGLAVGAAAMVVYGLWAGAFDVHTVTAVVGMAEAGGLGGLLARLRFRAWARRHAWRAVGASAIAGAAIVAFFSMATDTTEWVLTGLGLVPAAHVPHLGGLVLAGLSFNATAVALNAAVFGVLAVPTLRGLEALAATRWGGTLVDPLLAAADARAWRPDP